MAESHLLRKCRHSGLTLAVACGALLALPWKAPAATIQFLEEPGEGDFNVTGVLKVTDAKCEARLVFNWQDQSQEHYLLVVRPTEAKLVFVSGGKVQPLGNPAAIKLQPGQAIPFTLQRRDWRLALVWGDSVLLRGYDARLRDGQVGYTAEGAEWEDLRIQPVGDIVVYDDFVREAGAESVWEPQCGVWQMRTLRDDEQAAREEADKSANAFSYVGAGEPVAISVAGQWFWDRYALEASAKPQGDAVAGLVFYYQDDSNYLALRATGRHSARQDSNRVQLIAVRNGQTTVLADKPGGLLPGQWYKLRVEVCEDRFVGLVDGEVRLVARSPLFGQGQVGLYVEGKDGVFFDDVGCDLWEALAEDFETVVPGKWALGEGWVQKSGALYTTDTKPSQALLDGQWRDYACSVDAESLGGGVGLVFAHQGPQDYCLLRWAPASAACSFAGQLQLLRVGAEGENVLAQQPAPAGVKKARLRATVSNEVVTGRLGDGAELSAVVPGIFGGGVGLYGQAKGMFDNLNLQPIPLRRGAHVMKEFAETDEHPEMAEWASTRAPWVQPAKGQNVWWTKGDYFGNTALKFTVPKVGSRTGSLTAILAGDPELGEQSGLRLTLSTTSGAKKVSLVVSARDQQLGTAEVEVEEEARVEFGREGRLLVVKVNDEIALTTSF
ncbi:MAG: hypothetical protein HPY69_10380 [Armatimonadetes bacterium]|nr:hypothetical protein [Armatimonadota bacterium]